MPETIRDGGGSGQLAQVDIDGRLKVVSKSESLQHLISKDFEQAYQVIGLTTMSSGTVTALHVRNASHDKNLIATYIRHQVINPSGGTTIPNPGNYFSLSWGRTYVSNGATAVAVNVFAGSGNTAEVVAIQGNPTLGGIANEIDRWYTKSEGDMNAFNKEGALIVPPNQTIELSYIGNQTSGTIYTRLSFLMETINRG
jgi:hypothetical protein